MQSLDTWRARQKITSTDRHEANPSGVGGPPSCLSIAHAQHIKLQEKDHCQEVCGGEFQDAFSVQMSFMSAILE